MNKKGLAVFVVVALIIGGVGTIVLNTAIAPNEVTIAENTERPVASAPPAQGDPNTYDPILDKDYAQKILLLHQQIQQLSTIVQARSDDSKVLALAKQLVNESSESESQIKQLFAKVADEYMELAQYPQVDGHDMYPSHSGMATALEVANLSSLGNRELDQAYLKLIAFQYEGMLELAETTGKRIQFGELKTIRITSVDIARANIENIKEIKKSYETN